MAENGRRVREAIRGYVKKRTSGERASKVEEGVDLLSLFMQSPDVFTEDLIVDEMFDFFLAGQVTTQYASQTLIAHAAKDPECLRKIREEFAKVMAQQPEAESGKRSKREVMDIALDTETIGDLEYL